MQYIDRKQKREYRICRNEPKQQENKMKRIHIAVIAVFISVLTLTQSVSAPEPSPEPHFYTRIFRGEQVGYRGTPYAHQLFVRPSGDSSTYYTLMTSTDMITWTDAQVGGQGLFLIRIEDNSGGPRFFRFTQEKR